MDHSNSEITWGDVFDFSLSWQTDWPKREWLIKEDWESEEVFLVALAHEIAFDFELQGLPFGVLFNRIPSTLRLEDYGLSNSIVNALNRAGSSKPGDLLTLSAGQFLNFKHVGYKKASELVVQLVKLQTRFAVSPDRAIDAASASSREGLVKLPSFAHLIPQSEDQKIFAEKLIALKELSRFMVFCGAPNESIFEFVTHTRLIDRDSFKYLKTIQPLVFNAGENVEEEFASELSLFLENLKPREVAILSQRILKFPQPTLDSVGEAYGVTRERVRQIEVAVKSRIQKFEKENDSYRLLLVAIDLRLGSPMLKQDAIRSMPILDHRILEKYTIFDLMLGLGELAIDGHWVMRDAKTVKRQFDSILKASPNPKWLERRLTTELLVDVWPTFTEDRISSWMEHLGYRLILDHWVKNPTLVDFAYVALQDAKEPLTAQQILDLVNSSGNLRTLENALAASAIFSRTGKKQWSIASWGNQQYRSIKDAIEEIVDREGSIAFDQLVAKLSEFGVKRSSVRAYATSPPFTIVGGFVRRTGAKRIVRKTVESTRNLYFSNLGVAFRFVVTGEHLRGSGSACPVALAKHLDVPDQGGITFDGPYGPFRVSSKGHMYHLPSTRQAIEALGLGIGDQVLIRFESSSVSFSKVEKTGDSDVQIRSIIGSIGDLELVKAISRALFNHEDANLDQCLASCAKRGETDLHGLVSTLMP